VVTARAQVRSKLSVVRSVLCEARTADFEPPFSDAFAVAGPGLTVSVVVATYLRADQLRACLEGLRLQERPADDIVVVRRREDLDAASVVIDHADLVREVTVDLPGVVAALRAGAAVAVGDVVAFIDDDAVPRPAWLRYLLAPYSEPSVHAVGGRDIVHENGRVVGGTKRRVGLLSGIGRLTGNHHLGVGWPRDVHVLKGCNSSYRREALALPRGLRGRGAQVANDMATSLRVATGGARVVYEPRALVDHYPGPRFDEDGRHSRSSRAILDAAYNQTYVISSLRPDLRRRRLAFSLTVGDRSSPGALRIGLSSSRFYRQPWAEYLQTARTLVQAANDAKRFPLRFDRPSASV
jgi:GT2 family glycosyltransferase